MREVHHDVIVIGAGPAGIAAALAAADAGRSVGMVDLQAHVGGQIWRPGETADERRRALDRRLTKSTVVQYRETTIYDGNPGCYRAHGADGAFILRGTATVLALGALERFLPFPGWTTPGVFGAGGLQALVKGGFDVTGKRVAVSGTGPLLLAVADLLVRKGADVIGIFEQATAASERRFARRLWRHPRKLAQGVGLLRRLRRVPRHHGSWVWAAHGKDSLERVFVRTPTGDRELSCDLLACGFGLVPHARVARALGCTMREDAVSVDSVQATSVSGIYAAGECTSIGGLDKALSEGHVAGLAAAASPIPRAALRARDRARRFSDALESAYALDTVLRTLPASNTIICRCEDVRWSHITPYESAREAKLATRCGMGPCQGRVCNPALRFLRGWSDDVVRPPWFPTPVAILSDI